MHYAPIISSHLVGGHATDRNSLRKRVRHYYVRQTASWSNWWNMSVTEQPTHRTPTAPSLGARGRLPGV